MFYKLIVFAVIIGLALGTPTSAPIGSLLSLGDIFCISACVGGDSMTQLQQAVSTGVTDDLCSTLSNYGDSITSCAASESACQPLQDEHAKKFVKVLKDYC